MTAQFFAREAYFYFSFINFFGKAYLNFAVKRNCPC